MFGYIKPCKPELKIKEYEIYKGIYCSVCKCLSKNFGLLSKFTLSYDSTFLALLYFSFTDTCPAFKKGKCTVNPLKSCIFCDIQEKGIKFASSVCAIMAYYKVLDDIEDDKTIKKLKAFLLLPIIKYSYKKAKLISPEIEDIISRQIVNQKNIENKSSSCLDESADPTANMLSDIMSLLPFDEKHLYAVKEFSYFLGRWIYLIDAVDDFWKDKKFGSYNPFINNPLNEKNEEDLTEYMTGVLNQTLARVLSAYNVLELNNFKPIIDNIVILGLLETQNKILEKEKSNDRSL